MSIVADDRLRPSTRVDGRWVYVSLASAGVVIAFLGFLPTYWLPLAAGTLDIPPVRHWHAGIFFAWTLFVLSQTMLVANRRTPLHRQMGRVGVALAVLMVVTGVLTAASSLHLGIAAGFEHESKVFSIVPLTGILFFAGLFAAAVYNVRRPDVHKRLMMVAALSILEAPIARWFIIALAPADAVGPPPVMVTVPPALVVNALVVAAMIYDWKTRGRTHGAYLVGFALLVAVQVLRIPLSESGAWLTIAAWFVSVTG
jgi:hypothetical protein